MSTAHPRINIVTTKEIYHSISAIAEAGDTSLSATANDLIMEALERREDKFFSNIANKRDVENKKTISHKKIWGI